MPGASKAGRFSFRPTRRDEGPGRGVRVVQAESRHDSLERCRDSTPVHAAEFVASALAISHLPDHPLPSSDIDLLRTSAIDMVASLGTLTFDGSNADFLFRADLGVSDRILHQCIRPLIGACCVLRAIMEISAHAFSLNCRPRTGHCGLQISHAPLRPILHLV